MSLVALLLPVAAVVVLLSIFNGFGGLVATLDAASEGDLTIRLREGKFFDVNNISAEAIERIDSVEALSFVTEQMMVIQSDGGERSKVVTVRGVDYNYTNVMPIAEHVSFGDWGLTLGDLESVVVGRSTASDLGLRSINIAEVELIALRTGALQSYLPAGAHNIMRADVSGFLELDEVSEGRFIYASQRGVNKLLNSDNIASKVVIRISNSDDASALDRARSEIQRIVGDGFEVLTRAQMNPAIYQIIRYEKYGIMLICSLVMVIAAFSLLGAITMLILEKRSDIDTLRAIGATESFIRRIFLFEGWMIGGSAIVIGVILGVGVTLSQQIFGFIELPVSSTMLSTYPVELRWGDVATVIAIAVVVTLSLSYVTVQRVFSHLSDVNK